MISVEKRDTILDWLRGFGIILMVLGHINMPELHIYIYAFHMPLFYVISGYLCNDKRGFGQALVQRTRRLLIPYLFFGILNWFIYIAFHAFQTPDAGTLLFNLFLFPTKGLAIAGALWFLLSIFLVEMLFRVFLILHIPEWFRGVLVVSFLVLGFWVNTKGIQLLWGLETALIGLFFYYLGYLIHKYSIWDWLMKEKRKIVLVAVLFIGFIPCVLLCYQNGQIGMFFGIYGNQIFFIVNAIYMIAFWWMIARITDHSKGNILCRALVRAGKDSVFFLGINQFLIICCNKILPVVLDKMKLEPGAFYTSLFLSLEIVIVITLLYLTSFLTSKFKISHIWR